MGTMFWDVKATTRDYIPSSHDDLDTKGNGSPSSSTFVTKRCARLIALLYIIIQDIVIILQDGSWVAFRGLSSLFWHPVLVNQVCEQVPFAAFCIYLYISFDGTVSIAC